MQQFNLDIWLQDKSHEVVTRDGRPVRIICWDKKDSEYPIVGLVSNGNGLKEKEGCCSFAINGKAWGDACYDLVFADEGKVNSIIDELKSYLKNTANEQIEKDWKEIQDWYTKHFTNEKHNEEEELTEFEKKLKEVLYEHATTNTSSEEKVRQYAPKLLDLARKELEANYYTKVLDDRMVFKSELHATDLQTVYDMGKQDALRDLPKWKKVDSNPPKVQYNLQGTRLYKDGEYYIELSDLETLPKEE